MSKCNCKWEATNYDCLLKSIPRDLEDYLTPPPPPATI